MPSTKTARTAALSALLGSASFSAADLPGNDAAAAVDIAVKAGSRDSLLSPSQGRGRARSPGAMGAECVPPSTREGGRERGTSEGARIDVGVLSEGSTACLRADAECEADETSSLGGRCVAASAFAARRAQFASDEEDCLEKCPGRDICNFFNGVYPFDALASACSNGEHKLCLDPASAKISDLFYCPVAECMASAGVYADHDNTTDTLNDYFETCTICVGQMRACAFCKAGGDLPLCEEGFINYCDEARANETYMYHPGCADFNSSASGARIGGAAALALLSMALMSRG